MYLLTGIDINRISPASTHSSSLTAADPTLAQTPDRIEPRVLIINATPGSPAGDTTASGTSAGVNGGKGNGSGGSGGGRMKGGYVGLMNCVFAAQKAVCPPLSQVTCRVDSSCLASGLESTETVKQACRQEKKGW